MNAALIGVSSGLLTILIVALFKRAQKNIIYGLILSAIGFLYVGFTWTDFTLLIINFFQALFFLVMAYFGIKRNLYFLAAGYFLHGIWDPAYNRLVNSSLLHLIYDLFCLAYDFLIGIYLLILKDQTR